MPPELLTAPAAPQPAALRTEPPDVAAAASAEPTSHAQILRSSALVGGASLVTVLLSMLRTKVLAVLLGPAGVGLAALYGAIHDLTRSVAQLGVGSSGVRQMAEARAGGDLARVARVAAVVQRSAWVLGLLGGGVLALCSRPVATFTFGDDTHHAMVALLGVVVLFSVVADGHGALLQGSRRIRAMADVAITTALAGTAFGIVAVAAFGEAGIVPALAATAMVSAAVAWWQTRQVVLPASHLDLRQAAREAASLLRLGVAFMASGLLMAGSGYAVRVIVLRDAGLDAAGLFQGAWMVGGVYVGFILQALATDFYPRLVAAASDDVLTNRLVNEQAQVSLLLTAPGVLATLALAPLVLALLYSSRFDPATGLLRWVCIGMAMRVITWPMGFILVARGHAALFFATDLVWAVAHVGMAWWCVQRFGLDGAGIAFFASYLLHGAMVYPLVRRVSGFRWTRGNLLTAGGMLALAALSFVGFALLTVVWATLLGIALCVVSAIVAVHHLLRLAGPLLPPKLRRLLARFGPRPTHEEPPR